MSGKYKIKIENKDQAIKTIKILIEADYLFFEKHRYNTLDNVLKHIRRNDFFDSDGVDCVRWLMNGYSDCNRIFGCADFLFEIDGVFGETTQYKVVTVEEFLQETKGTPCQQ